MRILGIETSISSQMIKNKKAKVIECELRGPITWNDFSTIKRDVEHKCGPLLRTMELTLFAKGSHDLRIKINNRESKLILKYRAKQGKAKFEHEVVIQHHDIPQLIDILDRLGEKQWVMSCIDKYEACRNNSSISFKFGSRMGDFFEIEEMVASRKDIATAIKKISVLAQKFGLEIWSQNTFEKISHQSWDKVKAEPLKSASGTLHPLISKTLNQIKLMNSDDISPNRARRMS